MPVGQGYVEATAGAAQDVGAFARVESGFRFNKHLSAFGEAEWNTAQGAFAGVGVRMTF